MQKLALLLLAITASMMFSLNSSVFAQNATETPDDTMTDQQATDEGADNMGETTTDEASTSEDTASEDEAMTEETPADTTSEEMTTTMAVQSPLQQLIDGTDPHSIQCGEGLHLVYKASTFRPACVKDSTYQVLLQRGWASAGVPSDDELMGMVSELPKPEPATDETNDTTEENSGEVNMEEGVNVDGQSTAGNNTNPSPQSYKIDLSESMEMGAN